MFALGHQIHVYDAAHVEVGMIRQKLFNLLPVFEIETGGIKRGQIEKPVSYTHLTLPTIA